LFECICATYFTISKGVGYVVFPFSLSAALAIFNVACGCIWGEEIIYKASLFLMIAGFAYVAIIIYSLTNSKSAK